MKHFTHFTKGILAVALLGLVSCSDDDSTTVEVISYNEHLTNITDNVIVETYADLKNKGAILFSLAGDLQANATAANLDAVKQAWRDTRAPWEASEGFIFGPVDEAGIDPAIDSWPVNVTDLDGILAGSDVINEAYVDAQIGEAKGFHTIEYLLWGLDGNKEVGDFTTREYAFLVAACENLKNKTAELHDAWVGGYAANFTNAGNSGSIFPSEKAALETLVAGIVGIADEVGNGKIETPLNGNGGSFSQEDEESRFSHNSKTDFANNIKSISNVYSGAYLIDGKGLTDIVAENDAALNTQINQEIATAIQKIEAIPGTFTNAIQHNRAAVTEAQQAVNALQATLEGPLASLVSNL